MSLLLFSQALSERTKGAFEMTFMEHDFRGFCVFHSLREEEKKKFLMKER